MLKTPKSFWRQSGAASRPLLFTLLKFSLFVAVLGGLGLAYLDAMIRSQFEGARWALPAKVFARPMELYEGLALTPLQLRTELEALGYRSVARPSNAGEFAVGRERLLLVSRPFQFPDGRQQSESLVVSFSGGRVSEILRPGGERPGLVRLDPLLIGGIYPANQEDRELVRLRDVPQGLIDALLATEDRDFYRHWGVSAKGIIRALWHNLRAGAVVQGGSTLTQQLVKNFFLNAERSFWRKLVEAPMALLLEFHYDKDAILEAYLNEVYLGQAGARAIHGFALASQHYFGRQLNDLSLAQLAMLAGLVKGPSYYDPRRHPDRAKQRRDLVLNLMAQQGYLSEQELLRVQDEPLNVLARSQATKGHFPAFLDLVKRQLRRDYRQEDLGSEGLRIFTTFDPLVQRHTEQSVVRVLSRLEKQHGAVLSGVQAATVVGNSQTGEVLAVVGARDPRFQGFNRALDAVRPIGSLVKPAVYLAALEQSQRYTLASQLDDRRLAVKNPDGSIWEPSNYDKRENGSVLLHQALAHSYNLATAQLGLAIGLPQVVDVLERLGVRRPVEPYPAMLLGALSLSPLEVMQLYQTMAANGFETPLRAIRVVTDAQGKVLSRYPYQVSQQFDPAVVHLLQYALQEVTREGTARSLYGRFPEHLALAGKTGTTNDQRDSWFAGFTGDYLAITWLGMDDNRPMPLTGSSGALPVWSELMLRLQPQSYRMPTPEGVHYLWVDDSTGKLTDPFCDGARELPFIRGSEPSGFLRCAKPVRRALNWFNRLLSGE